MPQLEKIDEITNSLKQYVNINYKLSKLEAIEHSTNLGVSFIGVLIISTLSLLFILFSSLCLAFYLSQLIGNSYIGFGIIAALYLLITIAFLSVKNWLKIYFREKIISWLNTNKSIVNEKNIKHPVYTNLLLQTDVLLNEKSEKEDELKNQFKQLINNVNPLFIAKEYLQKVVDDKDLQLNASSVGLTLGTNFIIEKILGRSKSIKGYLSSMLVEKFSSAIINQIITNIKTKK